jgi:peptidoglycan/xylan/chitin deacetylase (PgdA/CDA1 family)
MPDKLKLPLSVKLEPQIPQLLNNKRERLALFLLVGFFVAGVFFMVAHEETKRKSLATPKDIAKKYTPPSPTPTPTPRPLTFAEMSALYGPCVYAPALMYHHVQNMTLAKEKGQQNLTVDTQTFATQMQYLKDAGYQVVPMATLAGFFDGGISLPKKSVLLTFDDGYDDFYLNALPILKSFSFTATMFTPTGLVGNPGYLSWEQVASSSRDGVLFANHTWSHKAMRADGTIDEKEIATADIQLSHNGLDIPKVFSYPYGTVSDVAQAILNKYGYQLAFTTKPGGTLCAKQRLILPRIRIGNSPLTSFGL